MTCAGCGRALKAAGRCPSCLAALALPRGASLSGGALVIERVLAWGDTGVIYAAVQVTLARPVAIKELFPPGATRGADDRVIPADPAAFADELVTFLQEARALAAIRHPVVIPVFDVFEAHGTAYQVMERLAGEPFTAVLARGKLTSIDAAQLGLRLADGLAAVHAAGAVHGDVRPAHVIVEAGRGPVLIDFGAGVRGRADDAAAAQPFAPAMPISAAAADVVALAAMLGLAVEGQTPRGGVWPAHFRESSALLVGLEDAIASARISAAAARHNLVIHCKACVAAGPPSQLTRDLQFAAQIPVFMAGSEGLDRDWVRARVMLGVFVRLSSLIFLHVVPGLLSWLGTSLEAGVEAVRRHRRLAAWRRSQP